MFKKLIDLIEIHDTIIIFRHLVGDGDALGSQWGMYYYLKEKYPQKEVYAVGDDVDGYENIFNKPNQINDDKFKDSLAIIVDTANTERISDDRYKLCKDIIKIDHHLDVDSFGDLEFVYPTVTSTAEIVANILRVLENNQPLSIEVAKNLYVGIISDTQMFTIPGVNADTFKTAAYLCESDIDIAKIVRLYNEIDVESFKFKNFIANKIVFDDKGLAYIKILNKHLEDFNISHSQAKRNTNLMKNILGINVWVLFIEQQENPDIFDASLRSNKTVINDVASKYGGGGHKLASGVKNLNKAKVKSLIADLKAKL